MKLKKLLLRLVVGLCCLSSVSFGQDDFGVLRQKAEQGDMEAQTILTQVYSLGGDYTEAVKWGRLAAEQGVAEAQRILGCCYFLGQGVSQDYKEAAQWMAKSVKNDVSNIALVSSLWLCGSVEQAADHETFAYMLALFKTKADQDKSGRSLWNLGYYYKTKYFPRNIPALYWFHKSAQQGYGRSKELLKIFYLYLTVPAVIVVLPIILIRWGKKIMFLLRRAACAVKMHPHLTAAYMFAGIIIVLLVILIFKLS